MLRLTWCEEGRLTVVDKSGNALSAGMQAPESLLSASPSWAFSLPLPPFLEGAWYHIIFLLAEAAVFQLFLELKRSCSGEGRLSSVEAKLESLVQVISAKSGMAL